MVAACTAKAVTATEVAAAAGAHRAREEVHHPHTMVAQAVGRAQVHAMALVAAALTAVASVAPADRQSAAAVGTEEGEGGEETGEARGRIEM